MKTVISKHHSLPVDINNLYIPVRVVLLTRFSREKDALKCLFTNFGFTSGQALNEVMILLSRHGAIFISSVAIECCLLLTKIVFVYRSVFSYILPQIFLLKKIIGFMVFLSCCLVSNIFFQLPIRKKVTE